MKAVNRAEIEGHCSDALPASDSLLVNQLKWSIASTSVYHLAGSMVTYNNEF